MAAVRALPLAANALLAAAVAATLLAFSRHAADQPVLASRDAIAILLQLLQAQTLLCRPPPPAFMPAAAWHGTW